MSSAKDKGKKAVKIGSETGKKEAKGKDLEAMDNSKSTVAKSLQDEVDEEQQLQKLTKRFTVDAVSSKEALAKLAAEKAKGFLSLTNRPTYAIGVKLPTAVKTVASGDESQRFRLAVSALLDSLKTTKDGTSTATPSGFMTEASARIRFMKRMEIALNFVLSEIQQQDEESLSTEDQKLLNEYFNLAEVTYEEYGIHFDLLKDYKIMEYARKTLNMADEYGRNLLKLLVTDKNQLRIVQEAANAVCKQSSDVGAMYGFGCALNVVLDKFDLGNGKVSLVSADAAKSKLLAFHVPWGNLNANKHVSDSLGEYETLFEKYLEIHTQVVGLPGNSKLPREEKFFCLVTRVADPNSPHTNALNFLHLASRVTRVVEDAIKLIHDEEGVELSLEERYIILKRELCDLDEGAQYTKGYGTVPSSNSQREKILLIKPLTQKSRVIAECLQNVDFSDVCKTHMHAKGTCRFGDDCKFIHLTSQQIKAYPMCERKNCSSGNSCKFRHAGDTVNATTESASVAAKGKTADGAAASAKKGDKQSQKGKRAAAEKVLLIKAGDPDSSSSEEDEGGN